MSHYYFAATTEPGAARPDLETLMLRHWARAAEQAFTWGQRTCAQHYVGQMLRTTIPVNHSQRGTALAA